MFKNFFRMCNYVVKPDSQELTPEEEQIVLGVGGIVVGFITAIVAFRFVRHVFQPFIRG